MCLQKESDFKNSYILVRVDNEGQSYIVQAWQHKPEIKLFDIMSDDGRMIRRVIIEKEMGINE